MCPNEQARAELIKRRDQVAELHLKGWSQQKIADKLGISQATVSRDVSALQRDWRIYAIVNVETNRRRELLKLDLIEREAWASWNRSLIASTNVPGNHEPSPEVPSDPAGNLRCLSLIHKCITLRCRMQGLNDPKVMTHDQRLIDMDSEEREEILKIMEETLKVDREDENEIAAKSQSVPIPESIPAPVASEQKQSPVGENQTATISETASQSAEPMATALPTSPGLPAAPVVLPNPALPAASAWPAAPSSPSVPTLPTVPDDKTNDDVFPSWPHVQEYCVPNKSLGRPRGVPQRPQFSE